MSARSDTHVCLGAFAGAHGVRGEVRVKAFTEDPLDIAAYGPVSSEDGTREFTLKALRVAKGMVIARVNGVLDRDSAEALKGTRLYVSRDRLPDTGDEDTWYHADLIGLAAHTINGDMFGTVHSVQDYGAGDLLEIEPAHGGQTVFIPFTRDCVPHVDIAGRHVVIDPPELTADAESEEGS